MQILGSELGAEIRGCSSRLAAC